MTDLITHRDSHYPRSSLEILREQGVDVSPLEAGYAEKNAIIETARKLRVMRQQAELSQQQLAGLAGFAQADISRLESGLQAKGPSVNTLQRLARACGYTFEPVLKPMQNLDMSLEQRQAIEQRQYDATHDVLTGLLNKYGFEYSLLNAIKNPAHAGLTHAVCVIDLDGFDGLNQTHGHTAGDNLLNQVAKLLKQALLGHDLARLGGDKFGVLFLNCTVEQAAQRVKYAQSELQNSDFFYKKEPIKLTASAGVQVIDCNFRDAERAWREADQACSFGKTPSGSTLHIYQESTAQVLAWQKKIATALRANDRFRLRAQSIVPVSPISAKSQWFEVFVHLEDPELGKLTPLELFNIAASQGLAPMVDRWVVSHTLQCLAEHLDALPHLQLCTINISEHSMSDESFLPFVVDAIRSADIPPNILCFELSESALIDSFVTAHEFIGAMRHLGCSIALDEFGTGYSSLGVLKELAFDYLKIDRAFVTQIPHNPPVMGVVQAIVGIAQAMGIRTVAVGVETEETWRQLQLLGVGLMQGYFIDTPTELTEYLNMLGTEMPALTSYSNL